MYIWNPAGDGLNVDIKCNDLAENHQIQGDKYYHILFYQNPFICILFHLHFYNHEHYFFIERSEALWNPCLIRISIVDWD